jgi:hypothetical protein
MKRWFLLICLLLFIGCEPVHQQKSASPVDKKTENPPIEGVSYSGGDGSSIENAVIIGAPNNFIGVDAEYDWIKKNHPTWRLEQQSLMNAGGKMYDKMDFRTPEGGAVTLYFDITNFFGKM